MTPMNATAAGGMPAYDPYAGSTDALAGDPYEGMAPEEGLPPHVSAGGSFDPAYAPAATAYDPYAVEHYDPYAGDVSAADAYARSVDPYAAAYEAQQHPAVAGMAPADASAVAPMQPGLGAPQATVDDFAALGIFTPDELQTLAGSGMSPSDLGLLYHDIVSYLQTPEGQAELQSRMATAAQQAAAQVAPVEGGEPGWNDEWAERFRAVFKEQGLDSQTQLVLLQQLRSMELPEAALQQAFDYYATTPEGKAELQAVDEQVRAAAGSQGKLLLAMGGLTLGLTAIPIGIARSEGNLVRMLEASAKRAIANGSDDAARAAARVLTELKTPASETALRNLRTMAGGRAGALFDDVARLGADEASRAAATMLRGDAAATRRVVHPIRKMQLNGAARHLTPPGTRLPAREALKYGLGMRFGDTVADTAAAAGATTRGVTGGGAAATARAGATMGRAGGITRALGPIGLVAGTALGVWSVNKTMEAEGGFGRESAKMTGNVAGGLAGGVAGAAAGAALGSVVPVIGTGIGAIAGGIIGGLAGSFGGEKAGGGLFDLFD